MKDNGNDRLINAIIDLAQDMKAMGQEIKGMRQDMNKQLGGLNERVDGLNKRVDGLNKRVDGLNKRVDELNKRVDKLEREQFKTNILLAEHSRSIITLAEKLKIVVEHEKRISKLERIVLH